MLLGIRIHRRRELEIYLYDPEVLRTFLRRRDCDERVVERDQELIHRLVPDNLSGLLRELPLLPSKQAILLGWASELPVMVRLNHLEDHERPQSDDPQFWAVWSCSKTRQVDWNQIVNDWQQTRDSSV